MFAFLIKLVIETSISDVLCNLKTKWKQKNRMFTLNYIF